MPILIIHHLGLGKVLSNHVAVKNR